MKPVKIINNIDEIALNNQWTPATKFNSKNRIIDEQGNKVSSSYRGVRYQIIEKRERIFPIYERIGRVFAGILLVAISFGLALCSKSIKHLITKSKENQRFAKLVSKENQSKQKIRREDATVIPPVRTSRSGATSPTLRNKNNSQRLSGKQIKINSQSAEYRLSEKALQEGMSISEETISTIQQYMEKILQGKGEKGIKFYNSQEKHRVFALDSASGIIFKMHVKEKGEIGEEFSMKTRYETMINAQTVIRTHQLGLLVIPNAKHFTINFQGKEYEILAERKVDINPLSSMQEQYFQTYAKSLNETIRQLAVFICHTGFTDIEWRNIPILNNCLDERGNRKFALIDLEKIDIGDQASLAEIGLFGGPKRRGLVKCVNEEQGKIVEEVAKQFGISTSAFAQAHAARKQEIEEERQLQEYYKKKGIIAGDELIQKDENSIDFPEYPDEAQNIRKVIKELLNAINTQISTSSVEESIKSRRTILIKSHKAPFKGYHEKLIDKNATLETFKINGEYSNEAYLDATYLGYAVKKLINLGVIHKLVERGFGYTLQV